MTISQFLVNKMIEFAKLIHAAIGTDKGWAVILLLAVMGAGFFGLLGWMVDAAYISSLPKFDVNMDSANWAAPPPPFDPQKDSLIVLVVSISNSRSQSILKPWNLYVKTPGREYKRALPAPMGETLELKSSDPNSYRKYSQQDALYVITATKPIQPGDGVVGVLPFILEGIPNAELQKPETTFKLTGIDAFGKEHVSIKTRAQFVNEIQFPIIKDR